MPICCLSTVMMSGERLASDGGFGGGCVLVCDSDPWGVCLWKCCLLSF